MMDHSISLTKGINVLSFYYYASISGGRIVPVAAGPPKIISWSVMAQPQLRPGSLLSAGMILL